MDSILDQTYENIELIILDDGSKDNTADKIKSYDLKCKQRFKNYIFIKKENEGICKTLNKGIKLCSGEYITIIASDDLMLPNKIEVQVRIMEKYKDIYFCWSNGYYFFDDNIDNKQIIFKKIPSWTKYNKEKLFKYFVINGNKVNNASCMYRKTLFDKIGYFDTELNFEDWDFYVRIIRDYKMYYIHEPLVLKRNHHNNTEKRSFFMYEGDKQTLEKVFNLYNLNNNIKRKAISNMNLWNASRFLNSDYKMYKYCIKTSFINNPFKISLYKFLLIDKPK
uniref:Putative glycosyltransferase n=1 Tax=Thermoanaerobacterium thermosaccharolyticum TaxID=1517 RepID=Q6TFB6_THETR|nr:putative glycosyltransferase [Thermoanaerobacterium thermosaccharolyticum]